MRTFATPRGDVWFTRSTPQDRSISGWSWFVTGGIVRTVLLGHCGRFAASSQKRERTQGKQHHREQPGHYHGGSDRGAQYAQLHPDPVAATMKGSEVACNRAAAREPLSPTIGLNTGTSASAAPPERSARTSSCIPLVMKKNGIKTPKPTAWSFVWKPVCVIISSRS